MFVEYVDSTKELENEETDLFISNCAFSELNREIQKEYLEKVIMKSKRGYITWNESSYKRFGGYSVDELVSAISGAIVIDEKPLTYVNNRIIIWGTREKSLGVC